MGLLSSIKQAAGKVQSKAKSTLKTLHVEGASASLDFKTLVTDPKKYGQNQLAAMTKDTKFGVSVYQRFIRGEFKSLGQQGAAETVKALGGSSSLQAQAASIGGKAGQAYAAVKGASKDGKVDAAGLYASVQKIDPSKAAELAGSVNLKGSGDVDLKSLEKTLNQVKGTVSTAKSVAKAAGVKLPSAQPAAKAAANSGGLAGLLAAGGEPVAAVVRQEAKAAGVSPGLLVAGGIALFLLLK